MKRLDFLKRSAILAGLLSGTNAFSNERIKKPEDKNFCFDDIFEVCKGNDRLFYPKTDSVVYKKLLEIVKDKVDLSKIHTYVPKHELCLEIKDEYSYSDFKPIEFFLSCVYLNRTIFTSEWGSGKVFFRFVKESDDRMHFEYFQGN